MRVFKLSVASALLLVGSFFLFSPNCVDKGDFSDGLAVWGGSTSYQDPEPEPVAICTAHESVIKYCVVGPIPDSCTGATPACDPKRCAMTCPNVYPIAYQAISSTPSSGKPALGTYTVRTA
jgi:hypothetical protein